jgi:tetratricopeptide (TPR) repeat protein
MKMNKPMMLFAALAISLGAKAQSLEDGIKMVKYERYESAKKILEPMAANNAAANYYLGLAELGMGNKEAARASFAKYPNDLANIAGIARLSFESGNAAEGQRLSMSVADKASKKDALPLVYAADAINYGGGDPQQAIDLYKKALEKKLDNVDVRIGLGDAYLKQTTGGGEAMNNYENAVTKDAKNSLGYSRIGSLWYAARNYDKALANYENAKNADPTNPLPYRDLANAYFYSGKYALARQNIEKYLEYSDKSCDDQIQYANILFLGKDYPAAIAKLNEVIGTCQTKPYMYRLLGYSQYETKDYPAAIQNMRTFYAKQDPKRIIPSDYLYMGKIYGAMKQPDSAELYYAQALTADTAANKYKTYIDIAESYRATNNEAGFAKSSEYYGKAIKGNDKATATDYFWYGTMTYYAKNYTEAAKIFEEMETKFPDQNSATYWRGRVAAAQDNEGKTGAAIQYYDKWLGMVGPDFDKKNDLLGVYRYYALVNYNKGNKAATQTYIDKITAINPEDELAKQLKGLMAKPAGKTTTSRR